MRVYTWTGAAFTEISEKPSLVICQVSRSGNGYVQLTFPVDISDISGLDDHLNKRMEVRMDNGTTVIFEGELRQVRVG